MPWRFNPFTGNLDETDIPAFNGEVTLGSAASPSIFFTGDPNTGIYSPGADQVAISTNGTGRLFVDASGNVGVGTISSNAKIVINSSAFSGAESTHLQLLNTSAGVNTTSQLEFVAGGTGADNTRKAKIQVLSGTSSSSNFQFFTTADGSTLSERLRITALGQLSHIGGGSSSSPAVGFNGSAPSNSLVIDSTGKVGLGTSSPSSLLETNGTNSGGEIEGLRLTNSSTATNTSSSIIFNLSTASATSAKIAAVRTNSPVSSDTELAFSQLSNGTLTERLRIDSSGNVGVGTTSPGAKLHLVDSSSPTLLVQDTTNNVQTLVGALDSFGQAGTGTNHDFRFLTNNTERLRITSDGKLGLGTSSPSSLLELSEDQGTTITLRRNNSAAVADDLIGKINFFNNDGSSPGARVTATVGAYAQATAGGTYLAFSTATNGGSNEERLRIDSSGNVGVGTTSPGALIHGKQDVNGTSNILDLENGASSAAPEAIIRLGRPATSGRRVAIRALGGTNFTSPQLAFDVNESERARIDSSGRLLVGTSTGTNNIRIGQKITSVATGGADYGGASLTTYAGADFAVRPVLDFQRSRGSTDGSLTSVASGDYLGTIAFRGSDGSAFRDTAYIDSFVEGTPAAGKIASRLVFSTTADGASSPTEQLRITSDRYVRLASGTGGIQFNGDTAAANALDDYEEGTFTPTIVGTTDAGTGTYTIQTGVYTKVGNVIHYVITILWTAHTGTGNMRIDGLPFTARNLANYNPSVTLDVNNLTSPANTIVTGTVLSNTTLVGLNSVPVAGGARASLALDTAGTIWASGSYTV